jgi:hypothetical protein
MEEEFARFQIDSPVHFVKCDEQDPPRVSDSDIDGLRERLESFVTFTLPSHIRSVIGGEARRSNGLEDTYSLCRLLYKFGHYSSAIHYLGAIHPRDGRPLYDVTLKHPDDLSSAFCARRCRASSDAQSCRKASSRSTSSQRCSTTRAHPNSSSSFTIYFQEAIPLPGAIISVRQDEVLSLMMVIDTDSFQMIELFSSLRVGDPFQLTSGQQKKVSPGLNQFSFYAVDSE